MNSVISLRSGVVQKPFKLYRRSKSVSRGRVALKVTCKKNAISFDYLDFAETVNGRCAMQGFFLGSIKEVVTDDSIIQQVLTETVDGHIDINSSGILEFITVVALVTLGTAFTSVVDPEKATKYNNGITFTNDAEIINGRTAMIGFLILSMIHLQ